MTRGWTVSASTPCSSGLAAILALIAAGSNSLCGIGPMMPKWLRVGLMNTGIAPVMMIACRIDLWQLRSTTTTSPGATVWCHTILLDVLVPLVTKKQWSALKMRAALRSLAATGPVWSSNCPSSSTALQTSARNMFSPKNWWNIWPDRALQERDAAGVPRAVPGIGAVLRVVEQRLEERRLDRLPGSSWPRG